MTWFNFVLKTLWPHVRITARKEILAQAKAALVDVCKQARNAMVSCLGMLAVGAKDRAYSFTVASEWVQI